MANSKYLQIFRNFIFLAIMFFSIDNLGMLGMGNIKSGESDKDDGENKDISKKLEKNLIEPIIFKVCFIGETKVGKSQILNRLLTGKFSNSYINTIGCNFNSLDFFINQKKIHFQIFDLSGLVIYRPVMNFVIKDTNFVFFVYDVTNQNSFNQISSFWLNNVKTIVPKNCKFALIGNKIDLKDQRKVTTKETQKFADDNNMSFVEVSAKTGDHFFNSVDENNKNELFFDENNMSLSNIFYKLVIESKDFNRKTEKFIASVFNEKIEDKNTVDSQDKNFFCPCYDCC